MKINQLMIWIHVKLHENHIVNHKYDVFLWKNSYEP